MTVLSPLMSKGQLCAELGVSEMTLNTYRKKYKSMPSPMKLGGKLYWRRDDVEAWLRAFLPQTRA